MIDQQAAQNQNGHKQLEYFSHAASGSSQATFAVEYTPEYWYVWTAPGAVGATALIYPDGAGANGFSFPLGPGGFAHIPNGRRTLTVGAGSGSLVVYAVAVSNADFRVKSQ